jgi:hypothetical protein
MRTRKRLYERNSKRWAVLLARERIDTALARAFGWIKQANEGKKFKRQTDDNETETTK